MKKVLVVLGVLLWFALPHAEAQIWYGEGDVYLARGNDGVVELTKTDCPAKSMLKEGYFYAYKSHGQYVGCYVLKETKPNSNKADLLIYNWNNLQKYVYKDGDWGAFPVVNADLNVKVPVLGGYQNQRQPVNCVNTGNGVVSCF